MQLGIGRNIALFYMCVCVCVCTAVTSCQTKLRREAPNPFVALYLVLYSVYDFVSVAERNFMLSIFFSLSHVNKTTLRSIEVLWFISSFYVDKCAFNVSKMMFRVIKHSVHSVV